MGPVTNILRVMQFLLILAVFQSLTGCATSEKVLLPRQVDTVTESERRYSGAHERISYDVGNELKLDDLIAFAVENSPELKSIYYRWQASENRAPQVASLPDPRVTYGYFIEQVQTKTGAQEQTVGLSQTLPWFGKLPLKEKMAVKQAEIEYQEYVAARLLITSKIKKAYYEYAWLHDALQINRDHINLLKVVESVASIRYKSGKVSQSTLVQIQVEQGRIEDRVKELEALKVPISSSIYASIGLPSGELLPRPVKDVKPLPDLNAKELKVLVEQSNPDLEKIRLLKERAEHSVKLADKGYYPDLTFGLSYIDTDGGKDPTLATVSLNLPIWRKSLNAAKREALNQRESMNELLRKTSLDLSALIDLQVYYYENNLRKNKLYQNTLIPKAQQSIELALKEFETGSLGFSELLDAERTLLEFLLSAKRYSADAYKHLAEIENIVNSSLNETNER
ncbi:MAG: TolC family protein [Kiritimatiellae bacterium]|jgi:cobalt-zinc-cadmium efflux system outer membrane protein|nr:TolC family protein [Kiritimatiellia bacterium]